MATVKMKKGDKYADIFDSPETIAQAEKEGYVMASEKKAETKKTAVEVPPADEVGKFIEDEVETPPVKKRTSRQ